MMPDEIEITELLPAHAASVADLHIRGISTGFISSLGPDFVTQLYCCVAGSRHAFGLVAVQDGVAVGFVAFATNLNRLYRSVIARKGIGFAFILAPRLLSFQRLKRVIETLFYPSRTKGDNLPRAELLAIAVSPDTQKKGIACRLVREGFEMCRQRGITQLKVLVGADNGPANRLYRKCGFELAEQIKSHGVLSNVYVAQIATLQ